MDQLDDDLIAGLTLGILQSDPDRVIRVAATLLRNLQRDLQRCNYRNARIVPSDNVDTIAEHVFDNCREDAPETIINGAQRHLGEDGLLLAMVHVAGFSQKEAAHDLGITHAAARKRCQRTLHRLKKKFDA